MHLLGRGARRGRRRSRRRLSAAASPDGVSDAVRAATRPRPPARRGQEPSHRHRPDRPAPSRVPLRGSPERDRRPHGADRSSSRSSTTSRSCRPAARSTSTARAARSCSTTSRRRFAARAGRRWSPTCGGCPTSTALGEFLESSGMPPRGHLSSRTAGPNCVATPDKPTPPPRDGTFEATALKALASPDPHRRSGARRVLRRDPRGSDVPAAGGRSTSASSAC